MTGQCVLSLMNIEFAQQTTMRDLMRHARQQLGILIFFLWLFQAAAWSAQPQNSDPLQQSGTLMKAGDLVGAEREARLALRDSSIQPFAWTMLGEIRLRQEKYPDAIEYLNTALRLKPDLVRARLSLAEAYNSTGKAALAQAAFKKVLRLDPNNAEALFALAQIDIEKGEFDTALHLVEPIHRELLSSPEGILLLAQSYSGLKQKDALIELTKNWNTLANPSVNSSVAFSSLLVKSGSQDQALEVLERAKNAGQVSYELAAALGNLYISKNDLTNAFESYEAALSLNPDCLDCLQTLAKIADQQNDPEKALAYLIRAKRKQPNNPEILFEFGKTCLELDLQDDAITALQEAARLRPDNDSYVYVLASANVAKKNYAPAGKLFETLLAKHPDDPLLNYAMGSLLFLEVKLDDAEKYLRRSVELQPDQSAANYYLGLIAEAKGRDDQAAATFRAVLQRDPHYGLAWEGLGRVLLSEKQYPEAQQALEKAVVLTPDSVKAHYQLGILLGRTGKQDDAAKQFAIVQQLNAEEKDRLGMRLRILSPH